MTPSEIKKQTISQLQKTFLKMMSPEWDVALEGQPKNVVADAAKKMLAVQRARLRMENAELASILEKLKENEDALVKGKKALEDSLKDLEDVKNVLKSTAAFLEIVGRIRAPLKPSPGQTLAPKLPSIFVRDVLTHKKKILLRRLTSFTLQILPHHWDQVLFS